MGKFRRGSPRFFHAVGQNYNGADQYPNVRCGNDFDFNGNAQEKFLGDAQHPQSSPATLARRDNLRDCRHDFNTVHIFSGNFNRRSGGGYSHNLRLSGNGRDLGVGVSSKITEARRSYRGDFGDMRRIFIGDGRQSHKIARTDWLSDLGISKRGVICLRSNFP